VPYETQRCDANHAGVAGRNLKSQDLQSRSTSEEILRRASEPYERGAIEEWHDVDDWLQAESELITIATKNAA